MNQEQSLRIARRWKQLEKKGALPSPTDERVTVILRATKPHWTRRALHSLERHTRQRLRVTIVPEEELYDAMFDRLFGNADASRSDSDLFFDVRLTVETMSPIPGVNLLNVALARSEDQFVVLLDDATTVGPNWLPLLLWPFFDDPSVAIVGPLSNQGTPSHPLPKPISTEDELISYQFALAERSDGSWEKVATLGWPCLVLRRSALIDLGAMSDERIDYPKKIKIWLQRAAKANLVMALCRNVYAHALFRAHSESGIEFTEQGDALHRRYPLPRPDGRQPLITVLLLHFGEQNVFRLLESALEQSYPEVEYIFITDRPFETDWFKSFVRRPLCIVLDELERDRRALESAWNLARGDYIAYMDSTIAYDKYHLARLIDQMLRRPARFSPADEPFPLAYAMHRRSIVSRLTTRLNDKPGEERGWLICATKGSVELAIHREETDGKTSEERRRDRA